jgi:hypothetical protein
MSRRLASFCPWLGKVPASHYLFGVKGQWLAIPSSSGNQNKGPCGRISVLKEVAGLEHKPTAPIQKVFPRRGAV